MDSILIVSTDADGEAGHFFVPILVDLWFAWGTSPRQSPDIHEFGEGHGRGGYFHGVRVELVGQDFTKLTEWAPLVMEKLRTIKEIADFTADLEGGDMQLLVKVGSQAGGEFGNR